MKSLAGSVHAQTAVLTLLGDKEHLWIGPPEVRSWKHSESRPEQPKGLF